MARQSITFMAPLMKSSLEGEPASRSMYSMVKYEMQTASMKASLGLSTGSPRTS